MPASSSAPAPGLVPSPASAPSLGLESDLAPAPGLALLPQLFLEDFCQMAQLEARAYSSDFIAPAEAAYAWYQRFSYTTFALGNPAGVPGGRVAGFVNLFPVVPDVFEALAAGTFNDAYLELSHIVDINAPRRADEQLHMFLSCIVVDEAHRGRGLAVSLLRAAVDRYAPVEYACDRIVTDNVTPHGERLSQRLGFALVGPSDHDTRIYLQEYAAFAQRVRALA